jgi:hypothetical protein
VACCVIGVVEAGGGGVPRSAPDINGPRLGTVGSPGGGRTEPADAERFCGICGRPRLNAGGRWWGRGASLGCEPTEPAEAKPLGGCGKPYGSGPGLGAVGCPSGGPIEPVETDPLGLGCSRPLLGSLGGGRTEPAEPAETDLFCAECGGTSLNCGGLWLGTEPANAGPLCGEYGRPCVNGRLWSESIRPPKNQSLRTAAAP